MSTDAVRPAPAALDNPFYYLDNFEFVLRWLDDRYADLLQEEEQRFLHRFAGLPRPSRALLVRMIMRRGEMFRRRGLEYAEIGPASEALPALVQEGWVDATPLLDAAQLCSVLTKVELNACFPALGKSRPKSALLLQLASQHLAALPPAHWHPTLADDICRLTLRPLSERLRLLFFGNLRQDWSEFVLHELGLLRYEKVELASDARGFGSRDDVDTWLQLHRCREQLYAGDSNAAQRLPAAVLANGWLESRRQRLLFALGQQHERNGQLEQALQAYSGCTWPAARVRHIRCLELCGNGQAALQLALTAMAEPQDEAESQQLQRMLPRLHRKAGLDPLPTATAPEHAAVPVLHLYLPAPLAPATVETISRDHLQLDGSVVFYVENTLLNALFGLLCWQAIFMPLSGAFFHPFQAGPADLYHPDFQRRRAEAFAACLRQLQSMDYRGTIQQNYDAKYGLHNAFVAWEQLDQPLLDLALSCIPAAHLHLIFVRMLQDLRTHRSGLPDLIQFWPQQQRYRMLEIKGPGDRVQDNQQRWLDYCVGAHIPVAVCHVSWQTPS